MKCIIAILYVFHAGCPVASIFVLEMCCSAMCDACNYDFINRIKSTLQCLRESFYFNYLSFYVPRIVSRFLTSVALVRTFIVIELGRLYTLLNHFESVPFWKNQIAAALNFANPPEKKGTIVLN